MMERNLVGFSFVCSLQFYCKFQSPFLIPDCSVQISLKQVHTLRMTECPLLSWTLLYSSASAPLSDCSDFINLFYVMAALMALFELPLKETYFVFL